MRERILLMEKKVGGREREYDSGATQFDSGGPGGKVHGGVHAGERGGVARKSVSTTKDTRGTNLDTLSLNNLIRGENEAVDKINYGGDFWEIKLAEESHQKLSDTIVEPSTRRQNSVWPVQACGGRFGEEFGRVQWHT